MKRLRYPNPLLNTLLRILILLVFSGQVFAAGDRNPGYRIRYSKSDMLIQNGGPVYDVTNPPLNTLTAAVGNGTTDDTTALRDAFDHVRELTGASGTNVDGEYIIWIPNGTYLVSDTITYYGPTEFNGDTNPENTTRIKFIGESRENTTLLLKDNATGFGNSSTPKPVLQYARPDVVFNNLPAQNILRNLTVDVGNNSGAVAVDYWAANAGNMHNLHLKSDNGKGAIGIHLRITVQAGYFQDITIDNFQTGIKLTPSAGQTWFEGRASHPVYEYITLNSQEIAGVELGRCSASFRKVKSSSGNPAFFLTDDQAHLILLDSDLRNGNSSNAAIQINGQGHYFIRNVDVSGYGHGLKRNSTSIESGRISEAADGAFASTNGSTSSLNLGFNEVPFLYYTTNTSNMIRPSGTSTSNIQSAMDSGKNTVYFTDINGYDFDTVTVPSSVRVINGMFQTLKGTINVNENSSNPLIVMDADFLNVINNSNRKILMYNTQWNTLEGEGEWHLVSIGQSIHENITNSEVYARWMNQEGRRALTINNNTWVQMGHKTEHQDDGCIRISGQSDVEILGSTIGVDVDGPVMIIHDDALVTYVGSNSANYTETDVIKDGPTDTATTSDFELRRPDRYIIHFAAGNAGITLGTYYITRKGSSLELALASDTQNNGNANAEAFSSEDDHLWEEVDAGNGYVNLRNKKSGRYLNVSGASTINEANIAQWNSNSSQHYDFKFIADGTHWRIQVRHSGKYLGTFGNSDGTNVHQTSTINDKIRWSRVPSGNYLKLQRKGSNIELALANDTQPNANVNAESASTSQDHQWDVLDAGNGYYNFRNVKSGMYLNVTGGNSAETANVAMWRNLGGSHYDFEILPDGNYYQIKARHSGKYLGTLGNSNGTNVQQTSTIDDKSLWDFE
jgi:hypothetical protein